MLGVWWEPDKVPALTELTGSVPLLPSLEEGKDSVQKGLHRAQTRHPEPEIQHQATAAQGALSSVVE